MVIQATWDTASVKMHDIPCAMVNPAIEAAWNAIRLTGATSRFSKVVEQLLRRLSLASAGLARDQHLPLCYGRRRPHVHHATGNMQRTLLNMQHATCTTQHAVCNVHYSSHAPCNMQLTKCNNCTRRWAATDRPMYCTKLTCSHATYDVHRATYNGGRRLMSALQCCP